MAETPATGSDAITTGENTMSTPRTPITVSMLREYYGDAAAHYSMLALLAEKRRHQDSLRLPKLERELVRLFGR